MTRQDDAGFTLIEAEPLEVYGIEFDLDVTRRPTSDPDVQAVSVGSAVSGTDRVLYILDGYVASGDPS